MSQSAVSSSRDVRRYLGSRVARRIFGLFAICTFLPLAIFALLALQNVTTQLEEQAESRLREACKSSGMTVIERLGNIVADVRMVLESPLADPLEALRRGPKGTRERLMARVRSFAIGNTESKLLSGTDPNMILPGLSDQELAHLSREHKLITIGKNKRSDPVIMLVLGMDRLLERRFLFCMIDTAYLWGGDTILRPDLDILAFTEKGRALYSSTDIPKTREALSRIIRSGSRQGQIDVAEEEGAYLSSYRTMFTKPQFFRNFMIATSQARDVVLAPIASFKRLFVLFAVLMLCMSLIASMALIHRSMVPIGLLTEATKKVRDGAFSTRVDITTRDEFRELGECFNGMADSLESHSETMDALYMIGVALTAERSSDRLIGLVAESAHSVTSADLVMLHPVDKKGHISAPCIRYKQGNERLWCEVSDKLVARVREATTDPRSGASVAATTGSTIHIEDLTNSADYRSELYHPVEELAGFRALSILCIPMRNHDDETIGVLELVKARLGEDDAGSPFSLSDRRVAESLASQAAVALTKNKLVDEFQVMFESLAELMATAIDEKSKYTGDHCRRVPVLASMVANEVCAASTGPFADVDLNSEELYELKIAALLHDCGKVTTPVHIVDKATKLEKIFDRMDLIICRFDVIKRDLTIEHLQKCLAAQSEDEIRSLTEELTDRLSAIEHDREFLESSNTGHEFMTPEAQAEVHRIAKDYEWMSSDGNRQAILTEDEIENLCIRRGTLTAADREIINHHIIATINMLENLSFPKHLARVPEIAGAHHEKMDGTGYPSGLKRNEISLQGRILGLCDVFEALTAKDRPYKPGKTLSETLGILRQMKETGHVDPDLFDLMVESGVYLEYAKEYLDPEQIDEVPVETGQPASLA